MTAAWHGIHRLYTCITAAYVAACNEAVLCELADMCQARYATMHTHDKQSSTNLLSSVAA